MSQPSHGLIAFLQQTDAVGLSVAFLLAAMSVASWAVILSKVFRASSIRRRARPMIESFWNSSDLARAPEEMRGDPSNPFVILARAGVSAAAHHQRHRGGRLGDAMPMSEFVTRSLRQGINAGQARLETGLSLLASVGSTAPFVGLFGTVWGVYHALLAIGASGQGTLDKVAGPVGEALIMTGAGLAVAIPAVLAYNSFVRSNRVVLSQLDSFAHDVYSFLTTGSLYVREAPAADGKRTPHVVRGVA